MVPGYSLARAVMQVVDGVNADWKLHVIGIASILVNGSSSRGHDEIDHTPTQSSWLVNCGTPAILHFFPCGTH